MVAVSLLLPTYLPSSPCLSRASSSSSSSFLRRHHSFLLCRELRIVRYLVASRHLGSPAPIPRVSSLAPLSFEPFGAGFGSQELKEKTPRGSLSPSPSLRLFPGATSSPPCHSLFSSFSSKFLLRFLFSPSLFVHFCRNASVVAAASRVLSASCSVALLHACLRRLPSSGRQYFCLLVLFPVFILFCLWHGFLTVSVSVLFLYLLFFALVLC